MSGLVSVVTVNYNNSSGLAKTIESVKRQVACGARLEHVIVDGGSSDGFDQVVKEAQEYRSKVISEPDAGIYDAMNKGVRLCGGDSVVFMNSGDVFFGGFSILALQEKVSLADSIVCCYTLQSYEEDFYLRPSAKSEKKKLQEVGHQGIFCPTRVLIETPFSLDYSVSADSVWKKTISLRYEWLFCECVSSVFDLGGVSSSHGLRDTARVVRQPVRIWVKVKQMLKVPFRYLLGRRRLYRLLYMLKYDRVSAPVAQALGGDCRVFKND